MSDNHYSEMDFLFSNMNNMTTINTALSFDSGDNNYNIFRNKKSYVLYKQGGTPGAGTNQIKTYLSTTVYNPEAGLKNPYTKLLEDFSWKEGTLGAGLRIKAADLVYLRDLGVYPINRMIILRRFPEGCYVPENLNEMNIEPISTIISWIKPEETFGKIDFHDTWTTTNERFDKLLTKIVTKAIGFPGLSLAPIPDFAQGMLFEFYKKMGLLNQSGINETVDETYEYYDPAKVSAASGIAGAATATPNPATWGLSKIPVGDPNVLNTGPFRDPEGQNITSAFEFTFDATYEQKLLGDVDPGSAMLDILDNIYAMGVSNMTFYWGDASPIVTDAQAFAGGSGNDINAWWIFVSKIMKNFWDTITSFFDSKSKEGSTLITDIVNGFQATVKKVTSNNYSGLKDILQSILTSTITIHRFHLRGSLELMVGGKLSTAPWYITLGNPYSPWLSTNHIVIKSASVETSSEMGFNDQPQRLKATFSCSFSRPLGKQELMRMFNNTYRRNYSSAPSGTATPGSAINTPTIIPPDSVTPGKTNTPPPTIQQNLIDPKSAPASDALATYYNIKAKNAQIIGINSSYGK